MLGHWDNCLIDQASDGFFFIIPYKILCKNCLNLFSYNFTKKIECPKSIRNFEKNNAWNTWSMSRLSYQPSKPAYYFEDCLVGFKILLKRTPCWYMTKSMYLTALGRHAGLAWTNSNLAVLLQPLALNLLSFISSTMETALITLIIIPLLAAQGDYHFDT